ncbi:MAG: MarR family winged helix-turn-helix transcriptional regulator [Acidimicrobiales bacterium]
MVRTDGDEDETEAEAGMWLDDGQQRAWRGVVQLFRKLPAAMDSDLQRTAGLTLFEFEVLAVLSESDRRTLQMSELAERTSSSLSRLSHVVSRSESRGWVTRQICPNDGRATQAVLTASGLAKVAEAAPSHVRTVRELVVDPITPAQLRQLGSAGVKIGQRIEEWNAARAANAISH